MSSDNGLSPPGTSTYSSNTLHVGDGTWDNGRDDFLLPNLVGLNFDTMRYNGMGNRFRGLPEYHRLIIGHGVLAAITFLGILPLAIFVAKFGFFDRRISLKLHVYCQILLVFLSTIVLVLGWFAVGPERSLTNPHHGIGVAIYVLIWAQFLFGWLMSRMERNRKAALTRLPLKVWCHKLLGKGIALMGGIQIALGLTLYGSPKYLFILYALTAAFLLALYICLDRFYFEKLPLDSSDDYYSEYGSYLSGSRTQLTGDSRRRPIREREDRHHWGRDLLAAGGVIGAYEAFKHRRMRKREEREQMEIDAERRHTRPGASSYGPSTMMSNNRPNDRPSSIAGVTFGDGSRPGDRRRPSSRPPLGNDALSEESWENEKIRRQHTWRDRILEVAGGAAVFEGARRLFGRKNKESTYVDDYRPPLGGNHSFVSQTDVSRVQQGDAPFSPGTPGGRVRPDASIMTPSRPPRRARPSGDSITYDEEDSFVSPPPRRKEETHTLRDSIAMFGAVAGLREWNRQRRERREHVRADRIRQQELQNEENFNRRTSNNYPRPQDAGRRESLSETIMTGATQPADAGFVGSRLDQSRTDGQRPGPDTTHPPLPANAGSMSAAYSTQQLAGNVTASPPVPLHSTLYPERMPEGYQIPPPPPGPPPGMGRPANYQPPVPGSAQMPMGAVNPDPSRLMSHENIAAGGVAALGTAALAAGALHNRRDQSESPSRFRPPHERRSSFNTSGSQGYPMPPVPGRAESAGSPPVSLKMRVHNDGRHVTLRRLKDEEIAAEQAAQRQERRQRQRRPSIESSGIGADSYGGSPRPRRGGPIRKSSEQPITNVPPPPPMSSSAGRRSDMTLPVPPPLTASPSHQRFSPNAPPASANAAAGIGSGLSGGFGSPGDAGTGTDVSAFADNRRRRRAERARRLEAARGAGNNPRVEFE